MDELFTMLTIDETRIAVPQPQISHVDVSALQSGDQTVYYLNGKLRREDASNRRRYHVFLHGDQQFAIACDGVETCSLQGDAIIEPLPACMRSPNSPVEQLILQNDELIFASNRDRLWQWLQGTAHG